MSDSNADSGRSRPPGCLRAFRAVLVLFAAVFLCRVLIALRLPLKLSKKLDPLLLVSRSMSEPLLQQTRIGRVEYSGNWPGTPDDKLLNASVNLQPRVVCSEGSSNRTLYLQCGGGISNRLLAIASGLVLAEQWKAHLVVVWPNVSDGWGSSREGVTWNQLFSAPELHFGQFPQHENVDSNDPNCSTVHTVTNSEQARQLQERFERRGNYEYLCMRAIHLLVRKQLVLPFHKSLRPSMAVADIMVNTTTAACSWNGPRLPMDAYHLAELTGQKAWELAGGSPILGVHIRRTDMLPLLGRLYNRTAPSLAEYVTVMKEKLHVAYDKKCPVVFLATDDDEAVPKIRSTFPTGIIVSQTKSAKHGDGRHGDARTSLRGLMEGVADMLLLGGTDIVLGTPGSTYSRAACLTGGLGKDRCQTMSRK